MNLPFPRRLRFAVPAALRVLWLVAAFLDSTSLARAAENPRIEIAFGGGLSWLSGQSGSAYDDGHNAGASIAIRTGLRWLEPRIFLCGESFHLDGSKLTQATGEVQIVSGAHRLLSGAAEVDLHRRALPTVRPYLTLGLGVGRVRDEFVYNDASKLEGAARHVIVTSAVGLRFRPNQMGAFAEVRWNRILSGYGDFSEFIRTSSGLTLGVAIRT